MSVYHDAEMKMFDLLCMQRQQDDFTHYHIPRIVLSLAGLKLKPKYQWSHSWANELLSTKVARKSIFPYVRTFKGSE